MTTSATTGSTWRTTADLGAALAVVTKAGDGVLTLVIRDDTGVPLMPAIAVGLAAVAARVTTVTAMDN
jgi:hypothetical protein